MAISVILQDNGGFLPDFILLTLLCEHHRGTRFNVMKKRLFCLCSLSLCSHVVNVLTIFPLSGGCSEDLDAFRFFFKQE